MPSRVDRDCRSFLDSMFGPLRILVVDDNHSIHRDFQKIIEVLGRRDHLSDLKEHLFGSTTEAGNDENEFEVVFADSGELAAKLVAKALEASRPFSVAFVDMRMPGWDGLQTAEQLWQLQPNLELIFSSAYMDYTWNEVTERLQRPGLRLLPKPWTGSQLMALLHEIRTRIQERENPQQKTRAADARM